MLRVYQSRSISEAESYYTEALSREDYYARGQEQEIAGRWQGRGAQVLGLDGVVDAESFKRLCHNLDPVTGARLTPRTKMDRTVGYDFNFHAPKGVSVLHAMTGDERIRVAMESAVADTMRQIEEEMQTRVRLHGVDSNRTTGNMVWGSFTHLTARPVGGVPDPHLHVHAFVFNATRDAVENRWKAGQFQNLKRDAPYFEACFHSNLADRLTELGYAVERRPSVTGEGRTGWDVRLVSPELVKRFSHRTHQIEKAAREKGITDPAAKAELGAKTRQKKAKEATVSDLKRSWEERFGSGELEQLRTDAALASERGDPSRSPSMAQREGRTGAARESVAYAVGHMFERASVIPERRLIEQALRFGVGRTSRRDVEADVSRCDLLRREVDGRQLVTTKEVLAEEGAMLDFARSGRGTCRPLGAGYGGHEGVPHEITDPHVRSSPQARAAVEHLLSSQDRVMAIRGGAGTGKTTLIKEAVKGIEAGGSKVFTFAPSADASRGVLRKAGFERANTVSHLLTDPKWRGAIKDQVVWVDEAGLISTKTMRAIFDLAKDTNARVILSGDTRQHNAVERGDALRALEKLAGITPAELTEIHRQSGQYKSAVESIVKGDLASAFKTFDDLGWIKELGDEDRHTTLAKEYLAAIDQGSTALVVSPTHREADAVTAAIRDGLKERGRVDGREFTCDRLVNLHLTEEQRKDAVNYSDAQVVVFNRAYGKIKPSERLTVQVEHGTPKPGGRGSAIAAPPPKLWLRRSDGERYALPLDRARDYDVFEARSIDLAVGDLVRITRNGKTSDKKHGLDNGMRYRITDLDKNGDIVLDNGWRIDRNYGHLAHGYCTTSHASQGQTVDRVFIAQGEESFPASNIEQFYVSVSRGRYQATIFTNDREGLMQAVGDSTQRLTASELSLGLRLGDSAASRALLNQRLASRANVVERVNAGPEPPRAPGHVITRDPQRSPQQQPSQQRDVIRRTRERERGRER